MRTFKQILGLTLLVPIILFSCKKHEISESQTSGLSMPMGLTGVETLPSYIDKEELKVEQIFLLHKSKNPLYLLYTNLNYCEYPKVGIYQWNIVLENKEYNHTMHIQEVGENYFVGYIEDSYYKTMVKWNIDHGTINSDKSLSFNVDFKNLIFPYYSFTGSLEDGLRVTGTVLDRNADSIGSWNAYRNVTVYENTGITDVNSDAGITRMKPTLLSD